MEIIFKIMGLGKIPYCCETGCWFGMMDVQCIGFLKMLDDLLKRASFRGIME